MWPKSTQRKQDKTSKNTWLLCTLLRAQLERHHTKTCAPSLECIIDIRPSKVAPELHVPSTENAQHVDSLWLRVRKLIWIMLIDNAQYIVTNQGVHNMPGSKRMELCVCVCPLKMYLATCWVPRSCEVTIMIWVHKAGNSLYVFIYVQFLSFHVLCLAFIYLYTFASCSFFSSQFQKRQNVYKNAFPHKSSWKRIQIKGTSKEPKQVVNKGVVSKDRDRDSWKINEIEHGKYSNRNDMDLLKSVWN